MDKVEARTLKYREVIHSVHPVFKGTCVHWRVNGELIDYKRNPTAWRLPLKYGYYVYNEMNSHNVHTFHRASDCPFSQLPKSKRNFFSPEVKQITLPFSEADKKRKGVSLP